ncbi:flagellar assembly protein FliW [Paenibacillus sp. LHD-38]|uniref:flagellar assembly protein FliW n=1 Tax=Paenibacillus sp. LHD-38 TaxID=3072143 RepID=UPI00280DE106|nr:flagellar assembly protein FliW [Paenibacillus sp. LHD-38]MDQ8734021.1 flagellar assembly protein FliW [Paenibacillus sp. LHD-38]
MLTEQPVYQFKQGIPGFEHLNQFFFEEVGNELPMKLMKAIEDQTISLLVASPFLFYSDYEWELPDIVKQELNIHNEEDVEIWSIITVHSDWANATINLLAPIVLNNKTKFGKQLILHDYTYSTRASLNRI